MVTRERAIIIILKIGVVIIVAVLIGRSKKLENPFPLLLDRFFFVAPYCLRNDSRRPVASIVFSVDRNTPHALPIFSTNYCSGGEFLSAVMSTDRRPFDAQENNYTAGERVRGWIRELDYDRGIREVAIGVEKLQEHNAANPFGGNGSSEICAANSTFSLI